MSNKGCAMRCVVLSCVYLHFLEGLSQFHESCDIVLNERLYVLSITLVFVLYVKYFMESGARSQVFFCLSTVVLIHFCHSLVRIAFLS